MSWQAQTAVNHHSKQTNMGLFRLLLYLAERASEDGRIDPAPSQATLAEFFGCTDRTIRNRINALVDSGELSQVRAGSGPGTSSAYQINLEIAESGVNGGKTQETNMDFVSIFNAQMVEIKAEILGLKAEIEALKVEKVEKKGGKGSVELSADDPITIQEDNNYSLFADAFEQKTGFTQKHESTYEFQDKWLIPIEGMLSRAKNAEHAISIMEQAVDTLWRSEKGYRITSPDSILKTYLNIIGKQSTNGNKGATKNDDGSYNV